MRNLIYIVSFLILTTSCESQSKSNNSTKLVGGPCQGCEAIYEYGNRDLKSIDTLPNFNANDPKLKISGTVFQKDGKTPAKDVIIYIYHTNRKGIYEKNGDEKGWGTRHGFIRGWVKTDANGNYTFLTFRPAAYPNGQEPEHIHMTVKEPTKNEYYIDDVKFMDDPLFTQEVKMSLKNRAGTGVVEPKMEAGIYSAKRNIILGLNIPNYD